MTVSVQKHYAATDIVARILAAVPWSPDDGTSLSADRLYPFDQLHGRELLATIDHAAKLSPTGAAHLLDIGSGIGGPARYFASMFGCKVTGIDLTPEFVEAATELARLTGLADQVSFVDGEARSMPFEADSFSHACCFYVGMNLADKPAVMAECFRVLQPGATLIWTEVTARDGLPLYPLPWARDPDASHLVSRETLLDQTAGAGFGILSDHDETLAHVELARKLSATGATPSPEGLQANQVVMGGDFMESRRNYIRSLAEGAIASLVITAQKPA